MLPLFARFPALARLPRAELGTFPTPVEPLPWADDAGAIDNLWLKRDDLNAAECGGNKVRALEFLLGGVGPGDVVLTVGGEGSTHVLATATHAARLGARTIAVRWPHDMNAVAERVRDAASRSCARVVGARHIVTGLARAHLMRLSMRVARPGGRRVRWIPLGGSTPLGILGHVNAGLELAGQVARGEMPAPAKVVVPLGSGGTAAGIALGLQLAGLDAVVVGARVGPRIGVNRRRVLALARATARFVTRATGDVIPDLAPERIEVAHDVYGGAYGRPLAAGVRAAAMLKRSRGLVLDDTYGAKALAAALSVARGTREPVLFWMTFDSRGLL